MKRKVFFTAIILTIIMALVPLSAEEIPYLEGYDIQIGPDTKDETGDYYFRLSRNPSVILPYFEKTGFSKNMSEKQALACLIQAGDSYVTSSYDAENEFVVIWAFLKDNPDYSLQLNYSTDGDYTGFRVQYDSTHTLFFKLYQKLDEDALHDDQWTRLSTDAQYACAFSSNLIAANNHSLYTFKIYDNKDNMVQSLADGWDCHNIQDVLDEVEILTTAGQHGSYNKIKAMLEDNPGKTVLDIARDFMLDNRDIMRLYFVQEMKDILGEHGIEAWDEGRSICLLRWAAEAGWISQEEAFERTKPITAHIRNSYSSWEDFMAHYIAGRGFFALTDLNVPYMQNSAFGNADRFRTDNRFSRLSMLSSADNPNPVMQLEDAFYHPTAEAELWNKCWAFFKSEPDDARDLLNGQVWLEVYPDIPCVHMLNIRRYFTLGKYSQSLPLFNKAAHCFKVPDSPELMAEGTLYDEFWYDWMILANNARKSLDAIIAAGLVCRTDNLAVVAYNMGLAYINYIGTAATQEQNDSYRKKAAEQMEDAYKKGYDVSEGILEYLGIEK